MIYKDYKISKRYTNASEDLLSEWKKYLGMFSELKLTKNKLDKMDKAVRCFLYNLCKFKTSTVKEMDVCLKESEYSKPLIYNGTLVNRKVSYSFSRMFIDFLVATGKAALVKGECYSEWDGDTASFHRERSKLVFSQSMLDWIECAGIVREALVEGRVKYASALCSLSRYRKLDNLKGTLLYLVALEQFRFWCRKNGVSYDGEGGD